MDKEPLGQALNSVIDVLDIAINMALTTGYDEVAAEEVRLGQIISRAQLVLSFIDIRRPSKFRVVQ